jgi:hypothetical protein
MGKWFYGIDLVEQNLCPIKLPVSLLFVNVGEKYFRKTVASVIHGE